MPGRDGFRSAPRDLFPDLEDFASWTECPGRRERSDVPSPYDQHIEELLGAYRRERAQVGELQRRMREVQSSATAPRQALKVSVNAQGEVTEIEFPTGAYKRMAPVELSQMLLVTIQ